MLFWLAYTIYHLIWLVHVRKVFGRITKSLAPADYIAVAMLSFAATIFGFEMVRVALSSVKHLRRYLKAQKIRFYASGLCHLNLQDKNASVSEFGSVGASDGEFEDEEFQNEEENFENA